MVSRLVINFSYYKDQLEKLGFHDVSCTGTDRDALNSILCEMKPDLMIISARFYQRSTPFMMGELLKLFPGLNIAAVSLDEYPEDLAMYFILNGVKSYVAFSDGIEEFNKGLAAIRNNKKYISPAVIERINMRPEDPEPAGNITGHNKEIIMHICNGYRDIDIAETLHISRRTVTTHKTEIFRSLNVRSSNELIRVAEYLGYIKQKGMFFYPKDFVLTPLPEEKILKRRGK